MKVRVELYGRLREAGLGESVELDIGPGARASGIIEGLVLLLGQKGDRLEGAAVATETEVLSGASPVPLKGRLAVLPPVCGG